jgi:hypothetical protein
LRRLMSYTALLVGLAACETSTNPIDAIGGGGGALTQAQATGNWSFTVTRNTTFPCTGSTLASGNVITAHLDVLTDGSLTSASSWQAPGSATVRPMSGLVRFTDGLAALILQAASGSNSAMELRGTITATGSFTGTLRDPGAGFSPPVFGVACEFNTTGTKTS